MINMKTDKILNYRVHIEAEIVGKKRVYNAHCPTLGLSDFGNTIDQDLKRVTELIEFHIESLVKLGKRVPVETDNTTVITSVAIPVSVASHFSLA